MMWFYQGSAGSLQIETRIDPVTKDYILRVEREGEPIVTERFSSRDAFEARVLALERQLTTERWKQIGGPEILPHGWGGDVAN